MPSHTELPHEIAFIRVGGESIAKRKDSYAIGFVTKRWPEHTAVEPPLSALVITIVWQKRLRNLDRDLLIASVDSFNRIANEQRVGSWTPAGKITRLEQFRNGVKLFCEFTLASIHDFAWLTVHFAKAEPVQRCEYFSSVEMYFDEKAMKVTEFT